MQAPHPAARGGITHQRERQLLPIIPGGWTGFNDRQLDGAFADSGQGVPHNVRLGVELCGDGDVLQLAAATIVRHIVPAPRCDTLRRCVLKADKPASREPAVTDQGHRGNVAGSRARNEGRHAIHARDAVTSGRDG